MGIDTGDTAFVLVSAALVLFMVPGLALFYAGMVRSKNVLSTMMLSVFLMGLVTVLWVFIGFTLAFGSADWAGGWFIGSLEYLGFEGVIEGTFDTIPLSTFAMFQLMFAIITPALIAGDYEALHETAEDYFAFLRQADTQTCLVVLNFSNAARTAAFDLGQEPARLTYSNAGRDGSPIDLSRLILAPFEIFIAEI